MLIEFDPEIFSFPENYDKIMFLFRLFSLDRRHDVFIDIDQVQDTAVYLALPEYDKIAIQEYFNLIMTQEAKASDYAISDVSEKDSTVLGLEEGIIFFNQKVSIILENSLYDKPFLKAIVRNFKKRAKKVNKHWENKWIEIVNGGGCGNIPNVVEERLQEFTKLTNDPAFYLRCFVLIDSDSLYLGHEENTRGKLRDIFGKYHIPYHILTKREMENYLPEEVYGDIPGNDDYIAAFLRLSPTQKDYFDLQNGFEKNINSFPAEVQNLYAGVNGNDMRTFRNSKFQMPNFKADFPKLFDNEKVTQQTLKKRVAHQNNPNELEDIIDKINELL